MRTTVTIEPEVEQLLREEMRRGRKSFKRALNDALRRGLKGGTARDEPEFVIAARPLGLREGIDPTRIRDLEDELEIDEFLRKTKRLKEQSS